MDEYLEFAKDLAYQSGKIITDNFRKPQEVETKSDNSPVTLIDKRVNLLVAEAIEKRFPEHGLMGEESNFGSGREEFQWLCDPIDGTKAFILGLPNCVFMLALMRQGQVLVSVVYEPFEDKLYHAVKDAGTFCNGKLVHVNRKELQDSYVLIGESTAFVFAKAVEEAGGQIEVVPGTGYKCTMLASGHGSGILKIETDYHDIGPASLIIEEAGGMVTGLKGEALKYNNEIKGAVLSNGVAHKSLLEVAAKTLQRQK